MGLPARVAQFICTRENMKTHYILTQSGFYVFLILKKKKIRWKDLNKTHTDSTGNNQSYKDK